MAAQAFIITGNVGSGKTTYSRKLAAQIGAHIFSVDEWMATLFLADSPEVPNFEWALERTQRVEAQVLAETIKLLSLNVPVILDQGFFAKEQRMRVLTYLQDKGFDVRLDYLDVPKDVRWMRVEKRNLGQSETYQFEVPKEIFEFCETIFEPLDEEELAFAHLIEQDE
jgi:predicted kinase